MKSVLLRFLAGVVCCIAPSFNASAYESGSAPHTVLQASRLGLHKRTSALVGRSVVLEQGGGAGTITDVLLDLPNNAVAGIALRKTNGVAVLVPCSAFTCVRDDRIAVTALPETSQTASSLASARECVGRDLVSTSGESVARVMDFMVDVKAARIGYVVTERPAEKRKVDTRLLPPSVVTWDADGQRLLLKSTAAHYLAGLRLHRTFPVEMLTAPVAKEVYSHYGLASEVRVSRGDSDAHDLRLTRAILASLPNSGRARQLEVVALTQNGRVVLEGVVASRDEERAVLAAAERIAGQGNVHNELRLLKNASVGH